MQFRAEWILWTASCVQLTCTYTNDKMHFLHFFNATFFVTFNVADSSNHKKFMQCNDFVINRSCSGDTLVRARARVDTPRKYIEWNEEIVWDG